MRRTLRRPMPSTATLRLSQLKKLISEEARKIIREEKEEEVRGEDSLDSQVDSFLSDFERKAKKEIVKKESRGYQSFLRKLLREAEEDEEAPAEEEPEEEEPEGEEGDEEDEEEKEPEKLTNEDIDVETFADEVVRLIENYDSLLEMRNTILRRAVNYLLKSYQPDVGDSFKEVLEDSHGIEIGKSKFEMEDEFMAPRADRAGNSPGGA